MVASTRPTRAVAGQVAAATRSAGQARASWVRSGPTTGGSVTVTAACPACSAPWVITVVTGGCDRAAVWPLAPIVPVMCGANGSAPQLVGVKLDVLETGAAGSPYGVASTVEVAARHDVGLRMNGFPPGRPSSVNESFDV